MGLSISDFFDIKRRMEESQSMQPVVNARVNDLNPIIFGDYVQPKEKVVLEPVVCDVKQKGPAEDAEKQAPLKEESAACVAKQDDPIQEARSPVQPAIPQAVESPVSVEEAPSPKVPHKLSDEDRAKILRRTSFPRQKIESAYSVLVDTYPGFKLEKTLGAGSFSEAILFSFQGKEKEEKQVLKLADIFDVPRTLRNTSFNLSEDRIGGEWLALLDFGEGVLRTEKALAYDHNTKMFYLFSAEEVQAMFNDPSLRQGKNLVLVGTISEYIEGSKTLETLIGNQKLSAAEVQNLGRQILQGIAVVHQVSKGGEGLVHRDIKPGNILITNEDKIKIFDFGFARLASREKKRLSHLGSPAFIAPEITKGSGYNAKVDSYALGVTLFQMITRLLPFRDEDELRSYILNSEEDLGEYSAEALAKVDPDLRDLIGQLGKRNPDERPTVEEALHHPFFAKELSPSS